LLIGKGTLLYDGSVQGLRSRFGTKRTITADYRENVTPLDIPGASLLSWTPDRAVISVDTEQTMISDAITSLSAQVELLDVTIDTQPIEDIIVQMYKEYQL